MPPKNEDLWIQRADVKRHAEYMRDRLNQLLKEIDQDHLGQTLAIGREFQLGCFMCELGQFVKALGEVNHSERSHFKKLK